MTLYDELTAAGCELSAWQSDLYVLASENARAIIRKYEHHAKNARDFRGTDGRAWIEIPFANVHFWQSRTVKGGRP